MGPVELRDLETGRRRLVDTADPRFQTRFAAAVEATDRARDAMLARAGARHVIVETGSDWVLPLARSLGRAAQPAPRRRGAVSFEQPLLLLLLLAVPLLAAAVVWWRRRRPSAGVPFPDLDVIASADPGPRLRRHLPLALAMLALAGFVFALARPEVDRQVPRERATIMLAIDVSGSMASTDVDPYRLRAAQDAAETFIDEVPRQYQVGLVSFSGQANLLVAPTTDRASLRRAIETLAPDGATAVGEAIESSLDAIRATQPKADGDGTPLEAARIVVLSDGATTVGIPPSIAAKDAKEAGRAGLHGRARHRRRGALQRPARAARSRRPQGDRRDHRRPRPTRARTRSRSATSTSTSGTFIGTEAVRSEVTAWPAGIAAALLILAGVAAWRFAPRLS